MGKSLSNVLTSAGKCASLCAGLSACATAHSAGNVAAQGFQGSVHAAATGAAMVKTTVGETYNGLGGAVKAPFRDFNMMQEPIPIALKRAKASPYDTDGLTSCAALEAEIRALDVELGPDIDTPRVDAQRLRSQRLASAAAGAALGAATSAVDHYIPVRGVVRELSGASKHEKELARATLAGSVRRGFLKAIGMQQNCAWPAAPVDFRPHPTLPPVQLASAATSPPPSAESAPVIILASAVATPPDVLTTAGAAPVPLQAPSVAESAPPMTLVADPGPSAPLLSMPALHLVSAASPSLR